jgi:uncharacterized membrane protein
LPDNSKLDYYYLHRKSGKIVTYILEVGFASNYEDEEYISNNLDEIADGLMLVVSNLMGKEVTVGNEEEKDMDWKSRLRSYPLWAGVISFVLLTAEVWGLTDVLPIEFGGWLNGILGLLVLLGLVNNPVTSGYKD